MTTHPQDAELISNLGGPTQVAELLGMDKKGGAQRVQNWLSRGIPASIKVKHPDIFMPGLAPALANTAQPATETVAQPVEPIQDAEPVRIGGQRRQGGRMQRFSMVKGV